MGLAELQRVLAKIYTDAELRRRFLSQPRKVAEELGVHTDETATLLRLSAKQVDFFASSLERKRLIEVSRLLPLTRRVLGKKFVVLFGEYARMRGPHKPRTPGEEAGRFCDFARKHCDGSGPAQAWATDILRYEAECLKAANPSFRWTLCLFARPIGELARAVAQGQNPFPCPLQPSLAIWYRLGRKKSVRHILLSLPIRPKRTTH